MPESETLAVRKLRRELAVTYSQWDTKRLVEMLAGDRSRFEPLAIDMMLREVEKRQCPDCGAAR